MGRQSDRRVRERVDWLASLYLNDANSKLAIGVRMLSFFLTDATSKSYVSWQE